MIVLKIISSFLTFFLSKRHHATEYKDFQESKESEIPQNQKRITFYADVKKKYMSTEKKQVEVTDNIVQMLASNIITFNALESPEFHSLINTLDSR